ncbi:MAG: hypothetical protein ACYTDT_03290 [Planctomycetota bacterium]|jgi:hypothetical protein
MLSPDGTVLHCLPGYWHPEDLDRELEFAMELWDVWKNEELTREAKDKLFAAKQLEAYKSHPKATTMRSRWQGFDAQNELRRVALGVNRDTLLDAGIGKVMTGEEKTEVAKMMQGMRNKKNIEINKKGVKMKPLNQLVHERMSVRPFVEYTKFDTKDFADYGRAYYDNNKKVDGTGSTLMTPRKVAKDKARKDKQEMKAKRRAERLAARKNARRKKIERS